MEILLCEDIDKLGWLGDIVDVASGYARNYLIPQGLAEVPTEATVKALSAEKAKRAQQRKLAGQRLEKTVAAVEGAEVVIAAKANEQGVLFGSVTEHDIASNLREQSFEVADKVVQLVEHIKHVGTEQVELKFSSDLTAKITVIVVPEQTEGQQTLPETDSEVQDGQTDKDG